MTSKPTEMTEPKPVPAAGSSAPTETSPEIDWADHAAERIHLLYRDSNYFKSVPKEPLIHGWADVMRTEFFKSPPVMFGFKTVEEWEKFTQFAASSALLPVGRPMCSECAGTKTMHDDNCPTLKPGWLERQSAVVNDNMKKLGELFPPALPVGRQPTQHHADTLMGVYCGGNLDEYMKFHGKVVIWWEGWQRVADYVNKSVASLPVGESRWMEETTRQKKNVLIRQADALLHIVMDKELGLEEARRIAADAHAAIHALAGILSDDPEIRKVAANEGVGESREPLPDFPDQPSEPMSPASVRVLNSILEARVPESNFLRDEPDLPSLSAEIESRDLLQSEARTEVLTLKDFPRKLRQLARSVTRCELSLKLHGYADMLQHAIEEQGNGR